MAIADPHQRKKWDCFRASRQDPLDRGGGQVCRASHGRPKLPFKADDSKSRRESRSQTVCPHPPIHYSSQSSRARLAPIVSWRLSRAAGQRSRVDAKPQLPRVIFYPDEPLNAGGSLRSFLPPSASSVSRQESHVLRQIFRAFRQPL